MKKSILLMALMAISCIGWSQPGGRQRPEPPSIEERLEGAKKELALTDVQVEEWRTIFEKYEDEILEARKNRDRQAGESIRTRLNEELMVTLNDHQQEKFKKMQAKRQSRSRRRG